MLLNNSEPADWFDSNAVFADIKIHAWTIKCPLGQKNWECKLYTLAQCLLMSAKLRDWITMKKIWGWDDNIKVILYGRDTKS